MKKCLLLAASLLALNLAPAFAQSPGTLVLTGISTPDEPPTPAEFNLDFPGGTPAQLVKAIEKSLGKPINVIIADEDAKVKLPPIKGNELDVPRLFQTLTDNGPKYADRPGRDRELISNYGFQTVDKKPSEKSLWTFYSYTKSPSQTQFSLDFPGGTPGQLIKAIEKAMGKPLNVIINKDDENLELPSLKMNDIYLPQLFDALEAASQKTVMVNSNPGGSPGRVGFGGYSYSQSTSSYGFKSVDKNNDSSVWYFRVEKPSLPPVVSTGRVCQYYSLAPYLNRGFTVDDITTAIQTGWKMAGEEHLPELNYHKETKLLIAFGEPRQLQTITEVLATLPDSNAAENDAAALLRNLERKRVQEASVPPPAPIGPKPVK